MPNLIIPFDAGKFFSEKGKWELIRKDDDAPQRGLVSISPVTGQLQYSEIYHGMRLKTIKYQKWVNLYSWGISAGYRTREEADQAQSSWRIECRLIEWES